MFDYTTYTRWVWVPYLKTIGMFPAVPAFPALEMPTRPVDEEICGEPALEGSGLYKHYQDFSGGFSSLATASYSNNLGHQSGLPC